MKPKYKFSHASDDGDMLYWENVRPIYGDPRVEVIRCSREWFWGSRDRK